GWGRAWGRGWSRFSRHGIRPTLRHNRRQSARCIRRQSAQNVAGRTRWVRVIGERGGIVQRGDADWNIHAADPRSAYRCNTYPLRRLFHSARIHAGDFGIVAPRGALGQEIMTAAGKGEQREKDDEKDERPLNSTRHETTIGAIALRTAQLSESSNMLTITGSG